MNRRIAVAFQSRPEAVRVEVTHGKLGAVKALAGGARRVVSISDVRVAPGPEATLVTVRSSAGDFSFFLRDVSARTPIFIPAYGVAVTEAKDARGYAAIARAVKARGLKTELQRIESEPEESFDAAAAATRRQQVPTWLGVSRDVRLFELRFREGGEAWHVIQPRFHAHFVTIEDEKKTPLCYRWLAGRGIGCVEDARRRLDEGVLPILHHELCDGGISYQTTAFVSLETKPLDARRIRGTEFGVADRFNHRMKVSDEEKQALNARLDAELARDDQPALFARVEAVNTDAVPRYAWFRSPFPSRDSSWVSRTAPTEYDARTGFGSLKPGGVFCVTRLDGVPLAQEETAVLVPPGESATFEFVIPHRPVTSARASKLAAQDFDRHLAACRRFWTRKLDAAARIRLPEPRIDEMVRAGLLHLEINTYGREPAGSLAATVGVYSPIGSESAPIIQMFDSAGRHDLARRALDYFLERQHPDGLMINFGDYRLETGGILWTLGEHYRYTRDEAWVRRVAPNVLKACEYTLAWRRRNMREELKGCGWGLVDGKVADPEDPYHSFMLNAFMAVGILRAAEMLAKSLPEESQRLAREAEDYRRDVRAAFFETMALSPAVPLGDGSWAPTTAPWTEARGPVCLFAEKGEWFTHGTFMTRDSLIGAPFLYLLEMIGARERETGFLLDVHAELMHMRNVAMSQPYYSPHPFAHLARGEVKAFLKAYYNTFAGLADRETYTFWEHLYHVSPHKTHEEGWFLMQTRRMLWTEECGTLRLLAGIPRAWMEDGKRIEVEGGASYFGALDMHVRSNVARGRITAEVSLGGRRLPEAVEIRLPHPQGLKAARAAGGDYDPKTETVRVAPFKGRARVTLKF